VSGSLPGRYRRFLAQPQPLPLFFPSQNVWGDELHELVVEYLQDFRAQKFKLRLLSWKVIIKSMCKSISDLLKILNGELGARFRLSEQILHLYLILSQLWGFWRGLRLFSEERYLHREGIHDVEFAEYYNSGGALFHFFYSETAIGEFEEVRSLLATEQRKHAKLCIFYSAFMLIVFEIARIEECVLLPGMPMKVKEHQDSPLIMHVSDKLFCIEDGWVKENVRRDPSAIQVDPEQRTSLVTVDNPIYI
jgi:hypothetical protein